MALEVEGIQHSRWIFTAGWPNASIGPLAKMCILVSLVFHAIEEMQPNTIAASTVNPSVVEVSTAGFLHQEASLSVQPAVEVKHSRFYCYDSESGDSDKSICSSELYSLCVMWACMNVEWASDYMVNVKLII